MISGIGRISVKCVGEGILFSEVLPVYHTIEREIVSRPC